MDVNELVNKLTIACGELEDIMASFKVSIKKESIELVEKCINAQTKLIMYYKVIDCDTAHDVYVLNGLNELKFRLQYEDMNVSTLLDIRSRVEKTVEGIRLDCKTLVLHKNLFNNK